MIVEQYYEILGLKPNASLDEVKKAYRNLAKNWHPDRFFNDPQLKQQAEEKIKLINQAYEALQSQGFNIKSLDSCSEIKTERTDPEFYYKQGVAKAELEQFTEAVEDFSRAIRIDPEHIKAYQYRGFIREKLGLQNAARSDFDAVFRIKLKQNPETSFSKHKPKTTTSSRSQASSSPKSHKPQPKATTSSSSAESPKPQPETTTSSSPKSPKPQPEATNFYSSSKYTYNSSVSGVSNQANSSKTEYTFFWECKNTIIDRLNVISSVVIDKNEEFFVSAGYDGDIKLWELKTGQIISILKGHSDLINRINCLCLSPDSKILVSGSSDKTIKLWNVETRKFIGNLGDRFSQHLSEIISVAISQDGKTLISNSSDRVTKIWDINTGKEIHSLLGQAIAISPKGDVFSNSLEKNLKIININNGKLIRSIVENDSIALQAFSPDSQVLAVVGCDYRNVNFWNLNTGQTIPIFLRHTNQITNIAFSSDKEIFISSSWDGTIKLCKAETREIVQTLQGHSGGVLSFAASTNARTIISGSADYSMKIWQRKSN
jgi:WD40 repeat protein